MGGGSGTNTSIPPFDEGKIRQGHARVNVVAEREIAHVVAGHQAAILGHGAAVELGQRVLREGRENSQLNIERHFLARHPQGRGKGGRGGTSLSSRALFPPLTISTDESSAARSTPDMERPDLNCAAVMLPVRSLSKSAKNSLMLRGGKQERGRGGQERA